MSDEASLPTDAGTAAPCHPDLMCGAWGWPGEVGSVCAIIDVQTKGLDVENALVATLCGDVGTHYQTWIARPNKAGVDCPDCLQRMGWPKGISSAHAYPVSPGAVDNE